MAKCQLCGEELTLPFRCAYCGLEFCAKHRLPETHGCQMVTLARPPPRVELLRFPTPAPQQKSSLRMRTSITEIEHLAIAVILLLLIVAFPLAGSFSPVDLAILSFGIFLALIIHELAHKFTAQKYGLWAEFRLNSLGLLITLLSIFSPIKLIAPGAVMIYGFGATEDQIGKISLSGPLTNVAQSLFFVSLLGIYPNNAILPQIALLNIWLAFFNLLPIGPFDGKKIFDWNKKVWGILFGISAVLFLIFSIALIF
jgi:Zn-dependent protease